MNKKHESKNNKLISEAQIEEYEKKLYDYGQLIEISKSLCSVLEFSTLIESILYTCMCQMRVLGAGMFVLKSFDSDCFTLENNYSGFDPDMEIEYTIPTNHPVISYLCETNQAYTIAELEENLENHGLLKQISSLNPSLVVPLKLKNHLNGILLLGDRIMLDDENCYYTEYERDQIIKIASLASIAINNASLIEQTTTDMMTHLKLKHYFFTVLTEKLEFSALNKMPISVLMLDIDFFKKFNDTYGHACGDFVLKKTASSIFDSIRGQDLAGRYGGEEFVVMLYNTDADAAMMVAERIRKNIAEQELHYEGNNMSLTISIGVSVFDADNPVSAKELVEMADRALYQSKANGRNRVTLADKDTPPVQGK